MTEPLSSSATDGSELMREFVPNSPFSAGLGITLEEIADGRALLRLPYDPSHTTYGDIVHGGAIATLADVAVAATAWAGAALPDRLRGATVSLSGQFVDAARAEDLLAEGRLIRRGRTLSNVAVEIRGADGRVVATFIAAYKTG